MRLVVLGLLWVLSLAASAEAQLRPVFHLEGGADRMLTSRYHDRFEWGGGGAVRAGLPVIDWVSVQLGFATTWFPVEDQDPGNLYAVTVGVRAQPVVAEGFLGGPFVDANIGLGLTGGLARPTFDVGVGWTFFPHPAVGVGPYFRYAQILQPNDQMVGDDARLASFGLSFTFRWVPRDEPAGEAAATPADSDDDGTNDDADACPDAAEDRDGFQDDDGCPEDDNDADGFLDPDDRCPDAPETRNGFQDDDGCPDEAPPPPPAEAAPPSGRDAGEALPQTVSFRVGSDRVSPRYRDTLREVCDLAAAQPDAHIGVIGHADEQGTPAANHRLGAQRAGSVAEQLVLCGVEPHRIESRSFGDTKRLCEDESSECRATNRRVEFRLIARPR